MNELEKAARLALEALGEIEWSNNSQWQSDRAKTAITTLRRALEQQQAPDLSHLKPHTQEVIKGWLADGTFVERALGVMQDQEREIMRYEQQPAEEPVACGNCNGTGRMVRDPDIGTDQECFVCEGSGFYQDTRPPQRSEDSTQPAGEPLLKPRTSGCTLCGYCAATGERIQAVRHEQQPSDHIVDANKMVEHQPAAQWVGLTDEDVMSIAFNFDVSSLSLVAKAVEAKLREKNGGKV